MRHKTTCYTVMLVCLVLALGAGVAHAAGQEPANKYTLSLTTNTQLPMFKMPAMPAGVTLPAGFHMPDFSAPTWAISGEAQYPDAAVEPIWVTVPGDLQLPNNQLPLKVYQPTTGGGGGGQTAATPAQSMSFTIVQYWHPDAFQGPLTNTMQMNLPAQGAHSHGPVVPIPSNVSDMLAKMATGSKSDLPKGVIGQGNYVLNTGGLTATLDGFLPPVLVSAPSDMTTVDLSQPLTLTWAPVAGARGFILHGMAMYGGTGNDYKIIKWVSTLNQPPERVRNDYLKDTSIADDLANGILLPPTTTQCVMPGGMFPAAGMNSFILTVTAVGNDFWAQENGATVIGTIRAKWTAMKMAMPAGAGGGQ